VRLRNISAADDSDVNVHARRPLPRKLRGMVCDTTQTVNLSRIATTLGLRHNRQRCAKMAVEREDDEYERVEP
jgi:hypothetical protein